MNEITTQDTETTLESLLKSKLVAEFPNTSTHRIDIYWLVYICQNAHICPYCGEFSIKLNENRLHCEKCADKIRAYAHKHKEITNVYKLAYTYWSANKPNLHVLYNILLCVYKHFPRYNNIVVNPASTERHKPLLNSEIDNFLLLPRINRVSAMLQLPTIHTDTKLLAMFIRDASGTARIRFDYLIYICQRAKICPYCGESAKTLHKSLLYCLACKHKIIARNHRQRIKLPTSDLIVQGWAIKFEICLKIIEKVNSLFPIYKIINETHGTLELDELKIRLDDDISAYRNRNA